jgi:hypothetical protein
MTMLVPATNMAGDGDEEREHGTGRGYILDGPQQKRRLEHSQELCLVFNDGRPDLRHEKLAHDERADEDGEATEKELESSIHAL